MKKLRHLRGVHYIGWKEKPPRCIRRGCTYIRLMDNSFFSVDRSDKGTRA